MGWVYFEKEDICHNIRKIVKITPNKVIIPKILVVKKTFLLFFYCFPLLVNNRKMGFLEIGKKCRHFWSVFGI